jgi:hypothetical protein
MLGVRGISGLPCTQYESNLTFEQQFNVHSHAMFFHAIILKINWKASSFRNHIILTRFLSFAMPLIISKYKHYIYILILYANRNYNMYLYRCNAHWISGLREQFTASLGKWCIYIVYAHCPKHTQTNQCIQF